MRTLAFALLLAVSGSAAALAQQDRSYYNDRAYESQRDRPNDYYGESRDRWNEQRRYDDQRSYEQNRDAERWREQQAYERGRDAERNQQRDQNNNVIAPLEQLFNRR